MMPPRTDGRYAKARLALAPYRILGSAPEPAFDIFAELTRAALGVPAALLAFFDGETMCVKAAAGTPQRSAGISARMHDVFAFERAIVSSDGARLFCGAPVATPDGSTVGVIAGIALDDRPATEGMHATIVAIAATVTHALAARRRATLADNGSRALVAFDAADLSLVFADTETMHARNATTAELQRLSFDDIFTGIDAKTRHDIDVLCDSPHSEFVAFTARALGPVGFWFPVACTARAVLERRMRTLIVVEFTQPQTATHSNVYPIPKSVPAALHEHTIDAVLSTIEAGRRALREEQHAHGTPLALEGFVNAAAQLSADTDDAHVLAVFRVEPRALDDAIELARRTRLLCDHDLVTVVDEAFIAMLLRDMPIAIGHQAVKRFARSQPGIRFAVRDAGGPAANVRDALNDAVAELRAPV